MVDIPAFHRMNRPAPSPGDRRTFSDVKAGRCLVNATVELWGTCLASAEDHELWTEKREDEGELEDLVAGKHEGIQRR